MRIYITSVFVDDQDKALQFYTEILGFVKKTEIPMSQFRWLTVVSPEDDDGAELVLEPDAHPAVGPFKRLSSRTESRTSRLPSATCRPNTSAFALSA